ncbi:MAG: NGG1p interacting factor NIF3, partial [Elusimicrobiota bacterium]|nr:NGG1p interacting factor NIF3 [Elusimicrobiota bacterium]
MKVSEFFSYCVKCGIDDDPRGVASVKKELSEAKKSFAKLAPGEKKYYDQERLSNPYADSRISNNPSDGRVKRIMCGIDIGVEDLLLADRLSERGEKIDLVVAHHPNGYSYSIFHEVMWMQAEIHAGWGVPINIAESLLSERQKLVGRSVMPRNHAQPADAASLLGIPMCNVHTPADNHVATFLQKMFRNKNNLKLKEIIKILEKVPEYDYARMKHLPGPVIVSGKESSSAGKIVIDMTGGTEGSVEAIPKFADAGVGTVIGM